MRIRLLAALVALTPGVALAQLDFVDTIPGNFIDIADTGTDLMIGDEGEAEIFSTIGNSVLPAGRVVIANNGGVGFDPLSTELAPNNEAIPSNFVFEGSQALLPFWDDIGNDIGRAVWLEMDNRLIVQWEGRPLGNEFITFQLQIYDESEATNPIAQFVYEDISDAGGGDSATIGYQDGGAGNNDVTWSFNEPMAVADGTVLTLIPEPASALLLAAGLLLLRRHA